MTREPFIAHSELTNEIYIVTDKEKYRVTEQVIKAVKATKTLEQEPFNIDQYCKEHFVVMVDKDLWEKAEKALKQEPKAGHWSHDGSHWKNRWICSECGYKLFDEQTGYCPNCGAKMEG